MIIFQKHHGNFKKDNDVFFYKNIADRNKEKTIVKSELSPSLNAPIT